MGEKYNYDRFEINDDDVALYGIIKVAKSYGFLEQIGYFYNTYNLNSSHHNAFNKKNANKVFHSLFTIMRYYYEKSENNRREKTLIAYSYFYNKVYLIFRRRIKYLSENFDYINTILNLYINSKYLANKNKIFLNIFLKEIKLAQLKKNLNN